MTSIGAEVFLILVAFEFTQLCLAIFHLLPIPGLDGARLVALVLPPDARRVYRDADRYLPLFVLVLWFLLAGVMKSLDLRARRLAVRRVRRVRLRALAPGRRAEPRYHPAHRE